MIVLVLVVAVAVLGAAWWRASSQLRSERALWQERISNIAHDVRSPLLVISGTADVAAVESSDPASREAFTKIVQVSKRLGRMLENHVASAVVSGGRLRREWVPVEELAASALARLDTTIAPERIDIQIESDALAHVDPKLVELVIGNLLEQAARSSPVSERVVFVARRLDHSIVLEVTAPHSPSPGGGARLEELAVCRAIAAAYGGSLELAAEPDRGTTVRVRMPDGEAALAMPSIAEEMS
ncbi:MAG TPA: hypothetical protein VFQ53_30245 [Kofleriaceae bacterium]|nr:hypothetical protein [Kofleriaceae bacterium]